MALKATAYKFDRKFSEHSNFGGLAVSMDLTVLTGLGFFERNIFRWKIYPKNPNIFYTNFLRMPFRHGCLSNLSTTGLRIFKVLEKFI
jgi:hypothetical protein